MKLSRLWRPLTLGAAFVYALEACAASVTITGATQRWPWNSKVDISYAVNDGQDVAQGKYRKLVFTAVIGGKTYTIDGSSIGASAADGPHAVTWIAPDDVKPTTYTIKADMYEDTVPSGDDYMIVDLNTGAVTYEGLYATQDASNARYNTAAYKTTKMAFRKVAKGRAYTIGDDAHASSLGNLGSTSKTWTPDYDYYIAVFECTIKQWATIYGGDYDSSVFSYFNDYNGDTGAHRAAHKVSWNMLRGAGVLPTATLGANAKGTVLERLSAKTQAAAGIGGFDLPTEVMFEIATRAGVTTAFFWNSDTTDGYANYVVCKESWQSWANVTSNPDRPRAVGMKQPNAWGLYDMSGNVWEWCRDDVSLANLANATDPFTPAYASGTANRRMHGGGPYNNDITGSNMRQFYCSFRNTLGAGDTATTRGFRVAWVRW